MSKYSDMQISYSALIKDGRIEINGKTYIFLGIPSEELRNKIFSSQEKVGDFDLNYFAALYSNRVSYKQIMLKRGDGDLGIAAVGNPTFVSAVLNMLDFVVGQFLADENNRIEEYKKYYPFMITDPPKAVNTFTVTKARENFNDMLREWGNLNSLFAYIPPTNEEVLKKRPPIKESLYELIQDRASPEKIAAAGYVAHEGKEPLPAPAAPAAQAAPVVPQPADPEPAPQGGDEMEEKKDPFVPQNPAYGVTPKNKAVEPEHLNEPPPSNPLVKKNVGLDMNTSTPAQLSGHTSKYISGLAPNNLFVEEPISIFNAGLYKSPRFYYDMVKPTVTMDEPMIIKGFSRTDLTNALSAKTQISRKRSRMAVNNIRITHFKLPQMSEYTKMKMSSKLIVDAQVIDRMAMAIREQNDIQFTNGYSLPWRIAKGIVFSTIGIGKEYIYRQVLLNNYDMIQTFASVVKTIHSNTPLLNQYVTSEGATAALMGKLAVYGFGNVEKALKFKAYEVQAAMIRTYFNMSVQEFDDLYKYSSPPVAAALKRAREFYAETTVGNEYNNYLKDIFLESEAARNLNLTRDGGALEVQLGRALLSKGAEVVTEKAQSIGSTILQGVQQGTTQQLSKWYTEDAAKAAEQIQRYLAEGKCDNPDSCAQFLNFLEPETKEQAIELLQRGTTIGSGATLLIAGVPIGAMLYGLGNLLVTGAVAASTGGFSGMAAGALGVHNAIQGYGGYQQVAENIVGAGQTIRNYVGNFN